MTPLVPLRAHGSDGVVMANHHSPPEPCELHTSDDQPIGSDPRGGVCLDKQPAEKHTDT